MFCFSQVEKILSDWKKIGVQSKIVTYEWGEYVKRAINGEHEALLFGMISNIPEPENLLHGLLYTDSSYNLSKWSNAEFDDLIQRATQTLDITERTRLYTQAQKIFKREQPFTPMAYATAYAAINKNVTGFKINPLGPTIFSGVGLK